ncbi:MAG TPA: YcnI family protein [Thermoanaerobaculia bacterium]|nr:YcnI family protein [Thermoanaerobaculia bacterium]
MNRSRLHLRRVQIFLGLIVLTATAAQAYVELIPSNVPPREYTKLFFRVYRGCEVDGGKSAVPTNRITVQVPEGVVLVRPQVKVGWQIATQRTKYPEPVQLENRTETEGFSEITWSGGPLDAEYMDDFVIAAAMPAKTGDYRFVVTQACEGGQVSRYTPTLTVAGPAGGGAGLRGYLPLGLAVLALLLALVALFRRRA